MRRPISSAAPLSTQTRFQHHRQNGICLTFCHNNDVEIHDVLSTSTRNHPSNRISPIAHCLEDVLELPKIRHVTLRSIHFSPSSLRLTLMQIATRAESLTLLNSCRLVGGPSAARELVETHSLQSLASYVLSKTDPISYQEQQQTLLMIPVEDESLTIRKLHIRTNDTNAVYEILDCCFALQLSVQQLEIDTLAVLPRQVCQLLSCWKPVNALTIRDATILPCLRVDQLLAQGVAVRLMACRLDPRHLCSPERSASVGLVMYYCTFRTKIE